MEQVYEETKLQEIVERNELQDDTRELVDNIECSKANPIRQPLFVIFCSL